MAFSTSMGEICIYSPARRYLKAQRVRYLFTIVDRNELIMFQHLENCVSMTAFCETDKALYFATITASA